MHPHYPECEALLLVEVDGPVAEVDLHMKQVRELCKANGAWEDRLAQSEQERVLVWKGRKAAFAAAGRLSPDYIVQDGVIPRTKLPMVLERVAEMAADVGLRVSNVFHAGDGNLHPLVLYDRSIPGQEEIAVDLSMRILYLCVDHGGSITGEHGVGREKQQALGYMYSEPDLDTMQRVRCSFDPDNIANPDKLFPRPRLCGEKTGQIYSSPAGDSRGRRVLLINTQDMTAPLAAMIGAEHLRSSGGTIFVAPANTEEIAAVLRLAQENGLQRGELGRRHETGLGLPGSAGAGARDASA